MNNLKPSNFKSATGRTTDRYSSKYNTTQHSIYVSAGRRGRGIFLLSISLLIVISLFLHPFQASQKEIPTDTPVFVHYKTKIDHVATPRQSIFLYLVHQPISAEAALLWTMLAFIACGGCILQLKSYRSEIYKRLLKLLLGPNKFRSTFVDNSPFPI